MSCIILYMGKISEQYISSEFMAKSQSAIFTLDLPEDL